MADIDIIIAAVKRLDAEATPGPWRKGVLWHDGAFPVGPYTRNEEQAKRDAALIAYYRTAAPLLAAEVERLQGEVERLTRDRERLTGYVRAALPLTRDALTHICEERPDEAARTIFRVICALASAVEEGDGR